MTKLQGKTLLVVDDEERNLFALGSYLESHNVHVITAANGEQALEILRVDTSIAAVLLDMMMPVKDGYDTLASLQQDDRLKAIPVIALTARAMKGDREKCIQAGAWDYVSKPADMKQLIEKLEHWIR